MKGPHRRVDFSGPNDSRAKDKTEKESDEKVVEKCNAEENCLNIKCANTIVCEMKKECEGENYRRNVESTVIENGNETLDRCPNTEATGTGCCQRGKNVLENNKATDDYCQKMECANVVENGVNGDICCKNVKGGRTIENNGIRCGNNCCESVESTNIVRNGEGADECQNMECANAVENGVNGDICRQNVEATRTVDNNKERYGSNYRKNVENTNIVPNGEGADDCQNIEDTAEIKSGSDKLVGDTSDYCQHIEGTIIFNENHVENVPGAEEHFSNKEGSTIFRENGAALPSSVGLYCNSVDDIEDIINSTDHVFEGNGRTGSREGIVKARIRQKQKPEAMENDSTAASMRSIIPGKQSVYVKTWGCTHNTSDSEYMAGQLQAYGYEITPDKNRANLWLLNSCTVKNPAEDHFRNEIESARKLDKYVVVAGCVPQGAPRLDYIRGLSVIGVQQIDRVVYVVEETLKGHSVRLMGKKKIGGKKGGGSSLALPKVRKNPLIEIIPISTGCLNACTYCKTKHARGELGSYPVDEIVSRATQAFCEGVKELWLTSEDTGAYGIDIGTDLPSLLRSVIEKIPAGCMLRLGMTNPPYIMRHVDAMCDILNHPRVYKFLHIPVQSASNRVLDAMKREYTIEQFCQLVDTLREKVQRITIATDIICGFPTETEEDFQETVNLCDAYKFPALYVNQFYARRGTPAARMPREASAVEVKKRTRRLCDLFHSYQTNEHSLGEVVDTLFTEISADGLSFVGHSPWYQQVVVPKANCGADLLGKVCKVEILEVKKYCLIGRVKKSIPLLTNDYFHASFGLFLLVVVVATLFKLFFGQNGPLSFAK